MQEYWGMLIGEIRHVCTVQIHDTLGLYCDQTIAIKGTRQKKKKKKNVENSTLGLTPPPVTKNVENFQKKKKF